MRRVRSARAYWERVMFERIFRLCVVALTAAVVPAPRAVAAAKLYAVTDLGDAAGGGYVLPERRQ